MCYHPVSYCERRAGITSEALGSFSLDGKCRPSSYLVLHNMWWITWFSSSLLLQMQMPVKTISKDLSRLIFYMSLSMTKKHSAQDIVCLNSYHNVTFRYSDIFLCS